jgi:alpha-1,2-mannosyltransferase
LPGGTRPGDVAPFLYSPGFAIASEPLSYLPLKAFLALWSSLSPVVLLACAYVALGIATPWRGLTRAALSPVLALGFLVFAPLRTSLYYGQVDCLILLLLLLACSAYCKRQEYRLGVWISLAILIKPFLAVVLLFLLYRRMFRAVGLATGIQVGALAVSAAVLGPQQILDFVRVSLYWSSEAIAASPQNQSLHGLLVRVFNPNGFTQPLLPVPLVGELAWVGVLGGAVGLGLILLRARAMEPVPERALQFSTAILLALVVSPFLEDIHLVYALVPLIATASVLWQSAAAAWARLLPAATLGLSYVYLSLPRLHEVDYAFGKQWPLVGMKVLLTGAHTYGLVLLLVGVTATIIVVRSSRLSQAQGRSPGDSIGGATEPVSQRLGLSIR